MAFEVTANGFADTLDNSVDRVARTTSLALADGGPESLQIGREFFVWCRPPSRIWDHEVRVPRPKRMTHQREHGIAAGHDELF